MISKDELIRYVAETCGISLENSAYFFDVFVNRVSNRLKPGEIINFNNYGYFQKRQCRIQLEKTASQPTPKSYLIHLVIFSSEPKVKSDLSSVQFLKIPNLKNLWLDDQDFLQSLNAGDFSPYNERKQLIRAFATKAEVILANQRKDYDSESESELVIPLTFDLNFLIRSGHKQSGSDKKESFTSTAESEKSSKDIKEINLKSKSEEETPGKEKQKSIDKDKKNSPADLKGLGVLNKGRFDEDSERRMIADGLREQQVTNERISASGDFEPVPSRLSNGDEEKSSVKDYDTVKFSFESKPILKTDEESGSRFTEVKSKTETFNLKDDKKKGKKKTQDDKYKSYRERKNIIPLVISVAFTIIALAAVYFYLFSDRSTGSEKALLYEVKPPSSTNVIERDYEFAVTYPYPKNDVTTKIEGYNPDIFYVENRKPIDIENNNAKEKTEKKEVTAKEKTEVKEKVATEKPVTEVKQNQTTEPEQKNDTETIEQPSNRIFLHKGFYVVYVGSFKSEEAANQEADKYSNMGYNPVIETIESRGRGRPKEYKLNVGDFTSVEFAKQFESKYLK